MTPFDKLFDAVAIITDLVPTEDPRADLDWMIDRLYEIACEHIMLTHPDFAGEE